MLDQSTETASCAAQPTLPDTEPTVLLVAPHNGRPADRVPEVRKSAGRRREEQRRYVRYPCELDVVCHDEDAAAGRAWTAKARNLSLGGVRLVTGRRVEPGTVFQIALPCRARGEWVRMVAQVVHATVTRYGSWVLGCAFERRLTADELQDLIS